MASRRREGRARGGATRAGVCAIVGRPNVGKSTLLNRLVGERVAAVTAKPQTTRDRLLGVVNLREAQVLLVDTPGVHRPHRELNELMVREALAAIADADVTLVMVDPAGLKAEDAPVLAALGAERAGEAALGRAPRAAVAAVNKIDKVRQKEGLLPVLDALAKAYPFRAIVPVSAATGEGVDALLDQIVACLPEGPRLFEEDAYTDRPVRFLAAEIVREQIFEHTGAEVPYSAAVTIEDWQSPPAPGRATRVFAQIHLERPSQKGIVIGKGGAMLKRIGRAAREGIERLVDGKVMLHLEVRVEPSWTRDPKRMKKLGYGAP